MRLSIITINKDNADSLRRTIDSVASQVFDDYEYIVIDGGSRDGSLRVIEDRRDVIDGWVSEPDHGIYDAQNKGISRAKGDYCLFLNSGDLLYRPQTLADAFGLGLSEDVVYGDLQFSFPDGKTELKRFPAVLEFDHMFRSSLPHPASFIRRELLLAAGCYRTDYRYVSDWIFFIDAVFARNCSYRHIDLVVASFDASGVTSRPRYAEAVHAEREKHLRSAYANLCLGIDNQDRYEVIRYVKEHRESRALRLLGALLSMLSGVHRKLKSRFE